MSCSLGTYSVGFFYFSSQLCCPLRFQNFPQTLQWEGFLLFGNFSFTTPPSAGRISIPNSLTLFLSFIFCPTSFRREWAAFLGAWCPPPAFRSCFVEVAQHSNDLLMILLWWKWSSHPIPLPSCLSFLRHYPCFALYQHLPACLQCGVFSKFCWLYLKHLPSLSTFFFLTVPDFFYLNVLIAFIVKLVLRVARATFQKQIPDNVTPFCKTFWQLPSALE